MATAMEADLMEAMVMDVHTAMDTATMVKHIAKNQLLVQTDEPYHPKVQ